jgi:hypothetical protein
MFGTEGCSVCPIQGPVFEGEKIFTDGLALDELRFRGLVFFLSGALNEFPLIRYN